MRFKHDCVACTPLGEFGKADLYYCTDKAGIPTVIARFSDYGSDFSIGIEFSERIPELKEAKRRAIEAGYLSQTNDPQT